MGASSRLTQGSPLKRGGFRAGTPARPYGKPRGGSVGAVFSPTSARPAKGYLRDASMKKDHTEVILCGRSKRKRAAVFTFSHHKSLLLPVAKVKVKGNEKAAAGHRADLLGLDLSLRYHFAAKLSTDEGEKDRKNRLLFLCKVMKRR